MSNHGAENIGDPNATFGVNDGQSAVGGIARHRAASRAELRAERHAQRGAADHRRVRRRHHCRRTKWAREFVRKSAMQTVDAPFDVVVTTNSGYPLDMNLYQGVKGMSAGARIIKPGGTLILAAECREGVPADSPLDKLLRSASSSEEILAMLAHARLRPAGAMAGADSGARPAQGARARSQLASRRSHPRRASHAVS